MHGTVKWFSREKGFGFIVGQDGTEYYVGVKDISGVDLPANGDIVEFDIAQGNRGPRATGVKIQQRAATSSTANASRDDRVTCATCQRKMVPRMITYRGEPKKSVCPYCGSTYAKFGWCFIATAVYDDYDAPEVRTLRAFRDHTLSRSAIGRRLVALYYRTSPPIAGFLHAHPRPAAMVRCFLDALIRILKA